MFFLRYLLFIVMVVQRSVNILIGVLLKSSDVLKFLEGTAVALIVLKRFRCLCVSLG